MFHVCYWNIGKELSGDGVRGVHVGGEVASASTRGEEVFTWLQDVDSENWL